ncbi:hypothetical protein C8R44DRAFT_974223 [Mycena epipterygia]|nr:hypothetical protein C8R44DRAFT_974223 [Mycena epipterygia]
MDGRLPSEVWFETFGFLPRSSLLALHAASRLFHGISRPLLFSDFDFHPFQICEGGTTRYAGPGDVARTLKRLEFWTSSSIAPFVRVSTFSVFLRSRDAPSPVFTAFFTLLSNFSNLREFRCFDVDFDQASAAALCALPNLARVQLTGCSLRANVAVTSPLRVKSFLFVQSGSQNDLRRAGTHRWMDMLDKDGLADLSIQSTPSSALFLEGTATSSFPNVHKLVVGVMSWSQISVLSRFPAVRNLRVTGCPPVNDDSDLEPALFPQLETYSGPHELLSCLDQRAALKQLCITRCDPQLLRERLATRCSTLRAVNQLILSLTHLQPGVLEGCLEPFQNLREFRMKVYGTLDIPSGEIHTHQTFYEAITANSPFPQSIEKIYIAWCTEASVETPPSLLSAQTVRNDLSAAHPGLRCVWLVAPDFHYMWIRRTNKEFIQDGATWPRTSTLSELDFSPPDLKDPFSVRYHRA